MRGFVINLDATVALAFLFFAMMIIATQTYNPRAPEAVYLKELTLDVLTVLEKTGGTQQAIMQNTSAIAEVVEATPKLACMSITVLNSTGDMLVSVTKSDCTETSRLDMQVTSRPAVYQGSQYLIKAESWFRKEPD